MHLLDNRGVEAFVLVLSDLVTLGKSLPPLSFSSHL